MTEATSPRPAPSGLQRIVPFVVFAAGIFVVAQGIEMLLYSGVMLYRSLGWSNAIYDWSLLHFLVISALPFLSNLMFGAVFGMRYETCARDRLIRVGDGGQAPRTPNPGMVWLLVWVLVFNVPAFLASGEGGFPPESWYPPVYNELRLFIYMGNRGLVGGFCVVVGAARVIAMTMQHAHGADRS